MSRPALRFWASAAAFAVAFSAIVPLVFPYRLIGATRAADGGRIWLLTVFTMGTMLVLFGASALLGGRRAVGMRDVIDAGGIRKALDRASAGDSDPPRAYTGNAAAWCVAAGVLLLVAYFALWAATRPGG